MRFKGKVAAVTGAASGIGKATARRMAVEGAAVVIGDLNRAAGEALARDICMDGGRALFVEVDVSREDSVAHLVDEAVAQFGQLDVMYNNAGISSSAVAGDDGWWRVVDVNLTGVFLGAKHAARVMLPRGEGVIVSTASHGGTRGAPGGLYGATKAGVISLMQHVAVTFAAQGLRVNAISPGHVETSWMDPRRSDMLRRYWAGDSSAFDSDPVVAGEPRPDLAEFRQSLDAMHPTGKRAFPDDLARPVAFLASDEASFVNGHNLMATGLVIPPAHIRGVVESRQRPLPTEPIDDLSGKAVVVATEHAVMRAALHARFEREGARIVDLDPGRFVSAAGVAAALDEVAARTPIALVVYALRPDAGGEMLSTTVDGWRDELRANLLAPSLLVPAAIERVVAGGSVVVISDAAAQWGGPGSPGYCAAAGALTHHTSRWSADGAKRGVRVNCLIAEDLTHLSEAPALGTPISAREVAGMVGYLALEAPGLAGLQLDLSTTHPFAPIGRRVRTTRE